MVIILKWIFIFFLFKFLWATFKAYLHKKLLEGIKNSGMNSTATQSRPKKEQGDFIEAEYKVLKDE